MRKNILRATIGLALVGTGFLGGHTTAAQAENPGTVLWAYPGSNFQVLFGESCLEGKKRICHMHDKGTQYGKLLTTHAGKSH
jgi:hypothetical protein